MNFPEATAKRTPLVMSLIERGDISEIFRILESLSKNTHSYDINSHKIVAKTSPFLTIDLNIISWNKSTIYHYCCVNGSSHLTISYLLGKII